MTPEQIVSLLWALVALVGIGGFWLYGFFVVACTGRSMFHRRSEDEPTRGHVVPLDRQR